MDPNNRTRRNRNTSDIVNTTEKLCAEFEERRQNFSERMTELQERYDKLLERRIKRMRQDGISITLEAFRNRTDIRRLRNTKEHIQPSGNMALEAVTKVKNVKKSMTFEKHVSHESETDSDREIVDCEIYGIRSPTSPDARKPLAHILRSDVKIKRSPQSTAQMKVSSTTKPHTDLQTSESRQRNSGKSDANILRLHSKAVSSGILSTLACKPVFNEQEKTIEECETAMAIQTPVVRELNNKEPRGSKHVASTVNPAASDKKIHGPVTNEPFKGEPAVLENLLHHIMNLPKCERPNTSIVRRLIHEQSNGFSDDVILKSFMLDLSDEEESVCADKPSIAEDSVLKGTQGDVKTICLKQKKKTSKLKGHAQAKRPVNDKLSAEENAAFLEAFLSKHYSDNTEQSKTKESLRRARVKVAAINAMAGNIKGTRQPLLNEAGHF